MVRVRVREVPEERAHREDQVEQEHHHQEDRVEQELGHEHLAHH